MDEKLFEKMEDYIHGNLSVTEREQFEADMATDEQLREEVELHRQLIFSVETESLRQLLDQIHEKNFESEAQVVSMPRRRSFFPMAIAASVALLILAGWWIFNLQTSSPESVYAAYFTPAEGLPTTLGYSTNTDFAEGMVSYKLEEYTEALEYWQPLLEVDPTNDTLNYYVGVTFLANEQPDSAIDYLTTVVSGEQSSFRTPAQWYLALAYLKTDEQEQAKPLLEDLANRDNSYQSQSSEILQKMEDN
ncbi:MAG: tetratricopeptide repeat protein [Bacteroidota bacterium]